MLLNCVDVGFGFDRGGNLVMSTGMLPHHERCLHDRHHNYITIYRAPQFSQLSDVSGAKHPFLTRKNWIMP